MQNSSQIAYKSFSLIKDFLYPILEVQNQGKPPMNAYEAAVQILQEFPLIDG